MCRRGQDPPRPPLNDILPGVTPGARLQPRVCQRVRVPHAGNTTTQRNKRHKNTPEECWRSRTRSCTAALLEEFGLQASDSSWKTKKLVSVQPLHRPIPSWSSISSLSSKVPLSVINKRAPLTPSRLSRNFLGLAPVHSAPQSLVMLIRSLRWCKPKEPERMRRCNSVELRHYN